jgi:hypothetical protein
MLRQISSHLSNSIVAEPLSWLIKSYMLQEIYCKALEASVPGITTSLAHALHMQGLSFYHLPHHGNAPISEKAHTPAEALQMEKLDGTLLVDVSRESPTVMLASETDWTVDETLVEPYMKQRNAALQSAELERRDHGPQSGSSTFTPPSDGGSARRQCSGTGGSTPVPPNLDSDDDSNGCEGQPARGRQGTPSSFARPRTPNPFSPGGAFSPSIAAAPQPFQSPTYARQTSAENCSPMSAGEGKHLIFYSPHVLRLTKQALAFYIYAVRPGSMLLATPSVIFCLYSGHHLKGVTQNSLLICSACRS